MSAGPWEADRALSAETARTVVARRFPQVDAASLTYLASGWEFDVYRSDDGWVFRFPRRASGAELFEPERRVHELVAPRLPQHVAVPTVKLLADAGSDFPYRFAGHRFIPGVPADAIRDDLFPMLAQEIGRLLGSIHSIPEVDARAAGMVELVMDGKRNSWVDRCLKTLSALRSDDPVIAHAVTWLLEQNPLVRRFSGSLHFIHHDLSPRHLIVDPETGRLTGVIDWTDSILGDNARDFVFLVAWRGWPFVEEVLKHYPLEADAPFRARVERSARVLSVLWYAEALERQKDLALTIRCVYNAFRSGEPPPTPSEPRQ